MKLTYCLELTTVRHISTNYLISLSKLFEYDFWYRNYVNVLIKLFKTRSFLARGGKKPPFLITLLSQAKLSAPPLDIQYTAMLKFDVVDYTSDQLKL